MSKRTYFIIGSVVIVLVVILTIVFFWWHLNLSPKESLSTITGESPDKLVSPSSSVPITFSYEYHVSYPDTLILVDSQGRRTGEDPVTGILYREIPNTAYSEIGPGDSGGGAGELFFSESLNANFTVYVLGAETGSYWFDAFTYKPMLPVQRFSGVIQTGSMIAYVPNWNDQNPASSTLVLSNTVSSTARITFIPPNNLPLPPLP